MLIFLIHVLNVDNIVIFKTFNCFHIFSLLIGNESLSTLPLLLGFPL